MIQTFFSFCTGPVIQFLGVILDPEPDFSGSGFFGSDPDFLADPVP